MHGQPHIRFTHNYISYVLCGCETWSLTLRDKRRLSLSANGVLREIFGAKRDEVTGVEKTA